MVAVVLFAIIIWYWIPCEFNKISVITGLYIINNCNMTYRIEAFERFLGCKTA